jgi:TPR repeat protein
MLSIIASLVMSVASCGGTLNAQDGAEGRAAGQQSKCLTSEQLSGHELAQLIQAGQAGDTNSMARLEQYYLGRNNTMLARYWMERRAETGSPIAMHHLANLLLHQGGPENCKLAIAYLKKAASLTTDLDKRSMYLGAAAIAEGNHPDVQPCR